MRIKAVLFDLDGTLLPVNSPVEFQVKYLEKMSGTMVKYGYEQKKFAFAIQKAMDAASRNSSDKRNEALYWNAFFEELGEEAAKDQALFLEFYDKEFNELKSICGYDAQAAQSVRAIKKLGLKLALATNPVFPAVAVNARLRWTGLELREFDFCSTIENSNRCKPKRGYFFNIAQSMGVLPEECLMVGNDVDDDMAAEKCGMQTFLLNNCVVNPDNLDISGYRQGGFSALMEYITEAL